MRYEKQLNLRCSADEKIRVEEASEGNVSAYLRDLVFGKMDVLDRLDDMHDMLKSLESRFHANPNGAGNGPDRLTQAVQLELLLLMRSVASFERRQEAQAEVKRNGLEPWSYEAQAERGEH